jgi:Uma2 family endonuclease
MATAPNTLTPEEYLRLERASEEKDEYIDGQILAQITWSWSTSSGRPYPAL